MKVDHQPSLLSLVQNSGFQMCIESPDSYERRLYELRVKKCSRRFNAQVGGSYGCCCTSGSALL
jgi:hypothetical protein